MSKWVRIDRRYNNPYRLTGYAYRAILKWLGLVMAWVFVNAALAAAHVAYLILFTTAGLGWYAVHRARAGRGTVLPPAALPPVVQAAPRRFNAPPGWPEPPAGWRPPPGWNADPSWPQPPVGWQFWVPDTAAPVGERRTRAAIPQDIKIAVVARDGGRCRCMLGVPCHGYDGRCGSTAELHFDHVIPWVRGGLDTVANLQLLCGPCNRRKGADDIPAGG